MDVRVCASECGVRCVFYATRGVWGEDNVGVHGTLITYDSMLSIWKRLHSHSETRIKKQRRRHFQPLEHGGLSPRIFKTARTLTLSSIKR